MPKKTRTGKVAMDHARNVVAAHWPRIPVLEAQKSVTWIPDPRLPGGRRPISRREDLFAAFDILVLSLPTIWCVQVTTQTEKSQTATARKRKIEKNFINAYDWPEPYAPTVLVPDPLPHIEVWSWVARKYFYTWTWGWSSREWGPRAELVDPTMGRKVKAAAPKDDGLDEVF